MPSVGEQSFVSHPAGPGIVKPETREKTRISELKIINIISLLNSGHFEFICCIAWWLIVTMVKFVPVCGEPMCLVLSVCWSLDIACLCVLLCVAHWHSGLLY